MTGQHCLALTVGPLLAAEINQYVRFVRVTAGTELDPADAATQMLWHFIETNEELIA
jgi:hypothetical protein